MKLLRRIRNKITFFDIGLGAIILLLALSGYFFFKRDVEYITIRVKVTDREILYANTQPADWYASRFEIGDAERDALGRTIAEIVNVESFSVGTNKKAVYVDLRIKAVYDKRAKTYSSRGKTVAFGTTMRFYLSKVTFDGIVTEFPHSESQRNYRVTTSTVTVVARGLEPAVAAGIKKGDKIQDSNGTLIADVLEVNVKPAERITTTVNGDLLLRFDPLYKDLLLTVAMRTKLFHGEAYVFDNVPLKVGVAIPLSFKHASLETTNVYGLFSPIAMGPIIVGFSIPE